MKIISSEHVIYNFTPNMEKNADVNPGEIFQVLTKDCYSGQIYDEEQVLSEIDYSTINPSTGPIYINGAMPGDLLKIKIHNIEITSKGVALTVPGEGVLGHKANKSKTRILEIDDEYCYFDKIKIPIVPMIGVIGVAPSDSEGNFGTDVPWMHGGNMDTTDIKKGSTLYLSVNQEGGLLALGDCHAIMGDGEVCFTGCEAAARVTLKIDLIKDKSFDWPIVETSDYISIITSGHSTDKAIETATEQAVLHLQESLNISWEDAYILTSIAVDIRISQVVDPKKTVRASIPKYILKMDSLLK